MTANLQCATKLLRRKGKAIFEVHGRQVAHIILSVRGYFSGCCKILNNFKGRASARRKTAVFSSGAKLPITISTNMDLFF